MSRRERPHPTDGEVALRKEWRLIHLRLKVLRKAGKTDSETYKALCSHRTAIINELFRRREL